MSAAHRTVKEYTELFAKLYHKSVEQAEECVAVSLFDKYAKERDEHGQEGAIAFREEYEKL